MQVQPCSGSSLETQWRDPVGRGGTLVSANREGSRCGSDRSNKWIRGDDKMDRKVVLVVVGEWRD